MYIKNNVQLIFNLFTFVETKNLWLLFLLFLFTLSSSTLEVISLGSIIPFIAVFSSPELIKPEYYTWLTGKILDHQSLKLFFGSGFILIAICAALLRLSLLVLQIKLANKLGASLAKKMYSNCILMDYNFHSKQNSSHLISSIISRSAEIVNGMVLPILFLFQGALTGVFIIISLSILNFQLTISLASVLSISYLTFVVLTRKSVIKNGAVVNNQTTNILKILQEGLAGVRDIKLNKTEKFFINQFENADLKMRKANAHIQIMSFTPKFLIEGLTLTLIAVIILILDKNQVNLATETPFLGAMALGIQRLLPSLQQTYSNLTILNGALPRLEEAKRILNYEISENNSRRMLRNSVNFINEIKFNNMYFSYYKGKTTLKNINCSIRKGDFIGIIGETGSGKSTFMDLLLGLLTPEIGTITIDGQLLSTDSLTDWQKKIAHVPQNIFLRDETISSNIALPELGNIINLNKIQIAAKLAEIHDSIAKMPNRYETFVGEKGAKLSGGERQRLGIARALYREKEILMLDEATSSLDEDTERKILKNIREMFKGKTMVMISHRPNSLKLCDKIFKFHNGLLEILK